MLLLPSSVFHQPWHLTFLLLCILSGDTVVIYLAYSFFFLLFWTCISLSPFDLQLTAHVPSFFVFISLHCFVSYLAFYVGFCTSVLLPWLSPSALRCFCCSIWPCISPASCHQNWSILVLVLVSCPAWPYRGCGGAYGLCPESKVRLPRFILLESFSYSTCGFDFRHSL